MKRCNRLWRMAVLVVLVLLVIVPVVGAQDAPPSLPVTPLPDAGQSALEFLSGIAGALVTAPITLFVVGLLKRIKLLNAVKSEWLALIVALALTVVYWIAQRAGYELQLNSVLHTIEVAGPAIVTLVGTLFGAGALYNSASARNIPILGYQRKTQRTDESVGEVLAALQKIAGQPVSAAEMNRRMSDPAAIYAERHDEG